MNNKILYKITGLVFCLLFVLSGCGRKQAPVVLHEAHGAPVPLAQWRGDWVVLNYWATWCSHCAAEMTALNHFAHEHARGHIKIYGVNYDHLDGKALLAAMQKLHIAFPVLREDPRAYLHVELPGFLPVTLIVDPRGKVVREIPGVVSAQAVYAVLNELQHT